MAVRLISSSLLLVAMTTTYSLCAIAAPPKRLPPPPFFLPKIPPTYMPFFPPNPWWNIPPPDGDGDGDGNEGPPSPGGGGGGCSCSCSYSSGPPPPPPTPNVIMVGGDQKWRYGFNYTDWIENFAGDIYAGDILEFDSATKGKKVNVFLMNDYLSFKTCNMSGSVQVGNEAACAGSGGYKFQLALKQPWEDKSYYFACGVGNGDYCSKGNMKFAVKPKPRENNHW